MKNLGKFGFLLLIFFSLFSVVGGCTFPYPYHYTRLAPTPVVNQLQYPVYIDKNFGSADQLSIANAVDQWNYALNGHLKLVIVDHTFDMQDDRLRAAIKRDAFLILRINSSNPLIPTVEPQHWALGFTPSLGNHWVYLVRDRLENEDVEFITMHEIGHALGAGHTSSGLMYKEYSPDTYRCIDFLAVQQVARYQHWDVATLNYCQPGAYQPVDDSHKQQQSLHPSID